MQALESIKDPFKHKHSSRLHFGHKWFMHFGCANGYLGFFHTFFDETLFQDMAHIDDFPLLQITQVVAILSSCVTH
jgi:hypothetical protein